MCKWLKFVVHQLKGDLDWIVLKCLEKDRASRQILIGAGTGMIRRWDLERRVELERFVAATSALTWSLNPSTSFPAKTGTAPILFAITVDPLTVE